MIDKILIVTEGYDKIFMETFVNERLSDYKQRFRFTFVNAGGNTKLQSIRKELAKFQPSEGGVSFVIFDAEQNIENTKTKLANEKVALGLDFSTFLLPDNQTQQGNLETLLRRIIPANKTTFFQCWDEYMNCAKKLPDVQNIPDDKTAIYAYCSLFLHENEQDKAHMKNRDYTDSRLWDLHHPALAPLYNFLHQQLQKITI